MARLAPAALRNTGPSPEQQRPALASEWHGSRVNRAFDAIANDDLKIKMEVIDEGALIEGFQKIANRITLGVILAALIVGAALLMRVETSFTIFGYPGLAMLFFLVAAGGGIWLAYSILTGDTHKKKKPGA